MDEPAGRFRAFRADLCLAVHLQAKHGLGSDMTYTNGKITKQRTEKMPWNSDGARHAQVEFQ